MIKKLNTSIKSQKPMRAMLIGLVPCTMAAVYFFGWRSLTLVVFCCLVAYITEVIFETYRGGTPTESIMVSGALLGLSLPPHTPLWIAAVGTVFGVVFGKQVFGGFGKNVFNPAIVGRCFLYVCFPIQITSEWMEPGTWPLGRLASYADVDALTSATPLTTFQQTGALTDIQNLFLGNTAGSIGETCVPAILLGGAYIIYKRAADWRYPVSCLAGAVGLNTVLYLWGVPGVMDPVRNLLAGSLLFAAFFMVTEPVSGCAKIPAKWAYGFLIGCLWIVIRSFSSFPEATSFAILLGNTFGPLFDEVAIMSEQKKKAQAQA
ncbi:MAG: RnfABCDGE type electron transport complex subunit D [Desulfomonilaceae bacterium]|nr:RnfABCDGE type electron transport complex subunit D [Desulfomonilaceae bacterium]